VTQNRLGKSGTDAARRESREATADQHFRDLLEASSLGTPAARRIRSSTSADVVDDVRRRAMERGREAAGPRLAGARTAMSGHADSAEGHYLASPGKPMYRQVGDLQDLKAEAAVKARQSQGALRHAESTDKERRANHRGGGRSWLLRLLIPVAVLAEAVTAYVALESLATSRSLAAGLAASAALAGAGMACVLADRRLSRLPVPAAARILEGLFVGILMVLCYDSLRIQGAGVLTAAGAVALAGLISALGLLGIEETVVETRTFGIFLSTLRVSWTRWRSAAAATRLARIQARIEAAADRMTGGDNALVLAGSASMRGVLTTAVTAAAAAALAATAFLIAQPAGGANVAVAPPASLAAPPAPFRSAAPPLTRTAPMYIVQPAVIFAPGQFRLSKSAQAALRPVVDVINSSPGSNIKVVGYADDLGTADANSELSQHRAQAVAVFLEAHGVRASRLETAGYGDQGPNAPGPAGAGEDLGRCVVIFIAEGPGPA
jgi:outer membrane protein OmpA-like peptidoglycan-associated protein